MLDQECVNLIISINEDAGDANDTKWSAETLRLAHLLTQTAVARLLFNGSHPKFEKLLTTLKASDGQTDD